MPERRGAGREVVSRVAWRDEVNWEKGCGLSCRRVVEATISPAAANAAARLWTNAPLGGESRHENCIFASIRKLAPC
jgi:hypothetical protein